MIQLGCANRSLLETIPDGGARETSIRLYASETLLLSSGYDFSIPDQCRRGIVVER